MKKVDGKPRSLRELLSKRKYKVHYYQREYRWQKKQIEELLEDLTGEFLENYEAGDDRSQAEQYGHYFMGSIVLSKDNDETAIIDGQQRLTSFTLLLIYLNHLQEKNPSKVEIKEMVFSEKYGKKSYNIDVDERVECMDYLFNKKNSSKLSTENESVRNILERYTDIEELFPNELKLEALPFFLDWLTENVDFIEISAETEQDAHKIFVSMNDRGLSLTPTEMLKGYLLSEISDNSERNKVEKIWKKRIFELKEINKDEDSDFIKNWLRAQYASTIRETKKDAEKRDFDLIGTEFHKWVRENKTIMGLKKSEDFESFLKKHFVKYSDIYLRLIQYSKTFNSDFPYVFYNANRNFTFQNQVILSSIDSDDDDKTIARKINIVSYFLDYYISVRVFNFKTLTYSSVRNYIFNLTKKIRNNNITDLRKNLIAEIDLMDVKLDGISKFRLNNYTKRYMLHILARLIYFIEEGSDIKSSFEKYINREQKNPYDIEHILAEDFTMYSSKFNDEDEFGEWRNKFGALLILPVDKNRSYQDKEYKDKLPLYFGENILAKSLHKDCYKNNPRFLKFIEDNSFTFEHLSDFNKDEIEKRQKLYKQISTHIWNKKTLLKF